MVAIDVRGSCFLPEGPGDAHHHRRYGRKRHGVDAAIDVARHRHGHVRFPRRPAAELLWNDRSDIPEGRP